MKLNIGMIGFKFMGRAHSQAYTRVGMHFDTGVELCKKVLCGREEEWLKKSASQLGWEETETDWKKLVERSDIDIVDITTPSNLHPEMAIYAAENGKHIFCEKPMALTLADGRRMLEAVNRAGVKHQIGFNYRFAPAVVLAKKMIDEGRLGKIFHFRGFYLQDWIIDPDFPRSWRLDKAVAGSGSNGDLNSHVIDIAHYLVGGMQSVSGMSKTFVTTRPGAENMQGLSGKADANAPRVPVEVDDATAFMCEFKNGALGLFEATRFAMGHKNDMYFEVNGEKGSIKFYFERMNELHYFDACADEGLQGWSMIQVSEGGHPYWDAWWPAGHVIGYDETFVHEMYEFVKCIKEDRPCRPDFNDALKVTQVIEAVEISAAERRWVDVESI